MNINFEAIVQVATSFAIGTYLVFYISRFKFFAAVIRTSFNVLLEPLFKKIDDNSGQINLLRDRVTDLEADVKQLKSTDNATAESVKRIESKIDKLFEALLDHQNKKH